MGFSELRKLDPSELWDGDCQFPWEDPVFAERILREYLKSGQDWMTRRSTITEAQVDFLDDKIFGGKPDGRILDLGCGPGEYCRLFASRGHDCNGVDLSPAAIQYAAENDSSSTYVEGDFLSTELGNGYDLVLLNYGAINGFPPHRARELITRLYEAAWPGGTLVLEVFNERQLEDLGKRQATWGYRSSSVFLNAPHVLLQDYVWSEEERTAVARYFTLAEDASSNSYAQTFYAYRDHEYIEMLQEIGARRIGRYPSLSDDAGMSFLIAGI